MDNYKEIKNFIHNDLKISKEDIQQIIRETVKTEVSAALKNEDYMHTLIDGFVKEIISKEYKSPEWKRILTLNSEIYDLVCNEVSKMVKDKIELRLKE